MKTTRAMVPLVLLAGCQMHSSEPTGHFEVPGNYQVLADCFFLEMRGEGFWRKDDLPSMNTSQVVMGNEQFAAGRVDFVGLSADRTEVTLVIPHPSKFEPRIRACVESAAVTEASPLSE